MVLSSHTQPAASPKLLYFLQQKLGLSENALNLGIKQSDLEQAPLPIALWRFGLLNLAQYQEVLDWEKDHL